MLIGIKVGAMTIDKLFASIRFFEEFEATTSKNCVQEVIGIRCKLNTKIVIYL